jgi:RES domain-containing protein
MSRERSLVERVAQIEPVRVQGEFLRHAAPNRDPFAGGYQGRWGASFPVIYLGRPLDSCVEEAYRHLVDDTGVPAHLVKARTLYTVEIEIVDVVDLRSEQAQETVGLTPEDLASPVGEYTACQRVAAAAHQLEVHGVLAPAATGLGETLAVFRERVSHNELPVEVDQVHWARLPARPGTERPGLRVVRDSL